MALIDTRLIQTAVIGGRESDQPVILPEQPHNLDEFRRQFGTNRFWCGTLLGGCGQKLMTKRYETKVCHFSHFPGREGSRACDRIATGVDSADHLFIKLHVKEWLAGQGHAAQAELRSLGSGPGDAVDFWLRATEQHLRFELRPEDYRSWRRAADSLGVKEGHVEWVFGPDGPITRDMVARQGYALRVRCETVGTDRRVLIGTVADNHIVVWASLESCRMTKDGIVTPELEALRAAGGVRAGGMRNDPLPGSLPLRGDEVVFAVDSGSENPTQSALVAEGRYLVSGFIKPAGSRIIRASVSLPNDVPAPTDQYVYRLSGPARLLITDAGGVDGSHYAIRADSIVRLNGLDAERTGLWRPAVSLPEQISAPSGTRRVGPARPEASTAHDVPGDGPSTVADQVRQELERVAAQRATTTWHDLARRVGRYLNQLPDPARRDLLVEVDKPGRPDAPLLCVLVHAPSGRDLPYLGAVLQKLGARAPGSGAGLRSWSGDMRERAYEKYCPRGVSQSSSPRQTVGEAPDARPDSEVSGVSGAASVSEPESEASSSYKRPAALLAERLRMRLRDAADVSRKPAESPDADLELVVQQAESHLEAYKSACLSTGDLRAWLSTGDSIVVNFERLISRAFAASQEAPNPPTPSGAATAATEQEAADAEALAQFQTILDVIRAAQADGNVAAVEAGRRMAGPLYARKLASADHERYTPFMREVKEWCLSHQPTSHVDPCLRRIRELLAELGHDRKSLSVDSLRGALHEIGQLRRRLSAALPAADEAAVKRWRGRLHHRELTERHRSGQTADTPVTNTNRKTESRADARPSDRLTIETIEKLAGEARQVLADQSRAGGMLLAWRDLRHRMGGALPHLHPDDQGELLVAVDRETPAGEPLLSTLIASSDASLHWLYRHVRFSLGRERIPDEDLEAHWAMEVLRLRQLWRHR